MHGRHSLFGGFEIKEPETSDMPVILQILGEPTHRSHSGTKNSDLVIDLTSESKGMSGGAIDVNG